MAGSGSDRLGHLRVGAFPLDASPVTDRVHRAFAVVAYASLALTPVIAGKTTAFIPNEGLWRRLG